MIAVPLDRQVDAAVRGRDPNHSPSDVFLKIENERLAVQCQRYIVTLAACIVMNKLKWLDKV